MTDINPRIYVADLAAYNAGKLHGVWIDATDDLDDMWEQVRTMLAASPEAFAEEHAIHDYEGFGDARIEEYQSLETVQEIAAFIAEFPEIGGALISHFCGDLEDARRAADENYCGEHKSIADYAQELTEETSEIPEHLAYYIDYEAMGRDMELNGDIFTIETGYEQVHIFYNH
ncbi:MAG TPA: antirestriction protein ArdA [Gammaproteobacteria bacterium]|nr:antirestriction protein ArdA [Gammaproteobacteria bacterium]